MKELSAAEFKTRCLAIMDEVRATREPALNTKRGKPLAKLVPLDEAAVDSIGWLGGVIKVVGDVESPVEPAESWKALR